MNLDDIKKVAESEKVQEVVKGVMDKAKDIDPKDLKEGLEKVKDIIPGKKED